MKSVLLSTILFLISTVSDAQQPKINKPTTIQKFKPPKVLSYWGIRRDSSSITVDEALQLLTIPIQVVDADKNNYTISSYLFLYRKLGVIEDEETGKTHLASTISSQQFSTTPLPPIWITSISEQLKTAEELNFYDIVVKDNKGHWFFAPPIKIKVN